MNGHAWAWAMMALSGFAPASGAGLEWKAGTGFREAVLRVPDAGPAGFTRMTPAETGVGFTNELRGDMFLTNAVAHNGSGLAIGDVDQNDLPDIYFCNLQGPNRLYRNLGAWRFEEIPLGEAACAAQLSTGAALADMDGDGDLDLLVNGIAAGTRLFLNDGRGAWTERRDSGLSRTASATSMALADIDGDGDLDLYCAHYIDVMHLADPTTRFGLAMRDGRWVVNKVNGELTTGPRLKDRFEALPDGKVRELPEAHALYRNDGTGRFTAIQFERGTWLDVAGEPIPPFRDWGLAAMFRDLNGDGAPDLYVCNDNASPDRAWMNTGRGTFRALPIDRLRHTSRSSMGLDFADLNRDGYDDLIVVDMLARDRERRLTQLVKDYPTRQQIEDSGDQPNFNRNTLFMGRPDGSFAETALMAGVAATDWSWCPIFLDVDLDGFEDLLVSTGFSFDVMDQDSHDAMRGRRLTLDQQKRIRQFHPAWPTPVAAFRNRGDGTFDPMERAWGFEEAGIAYGMALGDLDADGDLDLVVNRLNDAASLYRNNAAAPRIAIRLRGAPPNMHEIGARIELSGGSITQSQEMIAGGRYMSSDQALRVFAAGNGSAPMRLAVRWRNGARRELEVKPNRVYEVEQTDVAVLVASAPAPVEPFFDDLSDRLRHRHVEDAYDDWFRQPLLPRRLSRLGPGLAWSDVNGDGWDDLVVGAAKGGRMTLFINERGSSFRAVPSETPTKSDQSGLVVWPDGQGGRAIVAAASNAELAPGQPAAIELWANPAGSTSLSAIARFDLGGTSPGPIALADLDNDGDLDLWVGGRSRPGRYPEPAASSVWINEGGRLSLNLERSRVFESIGLASGATFCDLDGDGDGDLVVAIEWGPLRIFENDRSQFRETTASWGLAERTGCWNSVVAGDFDGDGRLDLAAGNWGRNTEYELSQPSPLRLVYGDWDGDGSIEMIEAWRRGGEWYPFRNRNWLARALPDLPRQFASHRAFAQATLGQILGARGAQAATLEAASLDSAVFLNRGGRFEMSALPAEAQQSPAFGLNVGDFDGDGSEDLFLSQNFFGSAADLTREDAGRGLWLRGTGTGAFRAVDAAAAGLRVDGEQRASATADFDHDGRLDLLVAQNDGPLRLFHNRRGRPGLRVSLAGPAGNPEGVGAVMRVLHEDGPAGPCRAVQAGSGYWSQDSASQILALPRPARALWVRWPDGQERTYPLAPGQSEIRATFQN